jgi:hypothetical protein
VRRALSKRGTGLQAGKEIEAAYRRLQHKSSGLARWCRCLVPVECTSSITLFRLRPSPTLGGQQGNVPRFPGGLGWQRAWVGPTCRPPRLLSTLGKGPSEGSACSRYRHRGDRGENFPYNCMRESPPPRPHNGIRTLDSKHFEIVKYLESKTGI